MSIERYHAKIVQEPGKAKLLKGVLWLFSQLWKVVSLLRNGLYDLGLFQKTRLSRPVISIGNIVAGGTGKTPLVAKLVEELQGQSAILSRGYRAKKQRTPLLVTESTPPALAGDEPLLLAKKTKAHVFTGKNRIASGKKALLLRAKTLILEDGLQHRQLARDEEIIVLDGLDPWGAGFFLPRGYLREGPSALKRASLVVVTRLEEGADPFTIEKQVRKYTSAPVVGMEARYTLTSSLIGGKVGAFCGIAKPCRFVNALKKEGVFVVDTLFSEDHKLPKKEKLACFARECQRSGAKALVCTEKDYIKLSLEESFPLPVYALGLDLVCTYNEKSWQEMVRSIQNRE